ncbi:MAG: NHLP bacteriocin system secretion protein [Marinobacter sp.]
MAAKKQIFRQAALDRLSSPEQLDQLFQVTTPKAWIALTTLVALITTAILWGIFGSIPTQVTGNALFLRSGGLENITVGEAGRLTDLSVRAGDEIREGQLIARLARPELLDELNSERDHRDELKTRLDWLDELNQTQADLRKDLVEERRQNLQEQIVIQQEQLATRRQLLDDGLITRRDYLATREKLEETRTSLQQLSITALEDRKNLEEEITNMRSRISDSERKLSVLEHQLQESTRVRSPYSGRVVEVQGATGAMIASSSSLVTLERTGPAIKSLEVRLFVSALDGKRISPGSEALLSPAGVKREEYGYLRGRVISVSEYPVTRAGMLSTVHNEDLVRQFTESGVVFEVRIDLIRDPDTPSGFAWTSAEGPPQRVTSGTLGSGQVTVRRQRPISLVVPVLRDWTGV